MLTKKPIQKNPLDLLTLPSEKSFEPVEMSTCSWMFYGKKRIGKSSLAGKFPNSVTFSFEQASKRVVTLRCDCPKWEYFLKYLSLYKREKSLGKVIPKMGILDTGFEAYLRCEEYVCKQNNVEHTSDNKEIHIWERIRKEFRRAHLLMQEIGMTLSVICHEEEYEQETRSGQKFDAVKPKLSKQADDYYRACIENVIYYHYRGDSRWLTLRGSDYILAGVIGDEDYPVFMTPDNDPIHSVYAGKSSKEAFNNLQKAFNCEQTKTYEKDSELFEQEQIKKSIVKKALKGNKR